MPLQYKSFETLVNDQAIATQAASTLPIDFNSGTVELALIEANAAMGVWLEYLCNIVLALARSSTCVGNDLDTWMAQFNLSRLTGVSSSGNVTFSRFLTNQAAYISVGALLKTTDFSLSFVVIGDTDNPNYDPATQRYVIAAGNSSVNAKVQCLETGTIGNVSANVITVISSPIANVDTVNNNLPFSNGKDAESDNDFRSRFVLYINSLSRAVLLAYSFALSSIPEITRYNVIENKTYAGEDQPGYVYTVIDDGTGIPSPDLIAKALAAIQKVRGLAILNDVYGPTVTAINIVVDLAITANTTEDIITDLVESALNQYISSLAFNEYLYYTKIFEIIYNSSIDILNVANLTVNGGASDIAGGINTIFTAGTYTIGYL